MNPSPNMDFHPYDLQNDAKWAPIILAMLAVFSVFACALITWIMLTK